MAIEIGLAAESVVCSLLRNNGFAEAYRPMRRTPFDLYADGRLIEVKASTFRKTGRWEFSIRHLSGFNPVPLSAFVLCLQSPAFAPGRWGFLVVPPELIKSRLITIYPRDLHRWHEHINDWAFIKSQPMIGYADKFRDFYKSPDAPEWAKIMWDHVTSKNSTFPKAEAILRKHGSL